MAENNWRRKGLFGLPIKVHHPENPGQELKTGIRMQELKQRAQRTVAYWLAFPRFLSYLYHTVQAQLPKESTSHCGLGPSTSSSNQENS